MSEPKRASSPRLVSEIPGTTRDTTDTIIRFHDVDYLFVDTAGLKRRAKTEEGIAMFASFRSIHAIEECDVTLLVLDALSTVSHQDQRIAGLVKEEGKGLIVLLNKIDLLKGEARETKTAETMHALSFCSFAPVLPCSTVSREGLLKVFPLIEMVQRNRSRRIPTHELHRWFQDTVHGQLLKTIGHAKHLTQADEIPPTFVLFVKNPKEVRVNELNFLENRLRETYDFTGTPVRFTTKRA
jgi:GTP-binding protein